MHAQDSVKVSQTVSTRMKFKLLRKFPYWAPQKTFFICTDVDSKVPRTWKTRELKSQYTYFIYLLTLGEEVRVNAYSL